MTGSFSFKAGRQAYLLAIVSFKGLLNEIQINNPDCWMMLMTGSSSFRAGRQACFLATVSFTGVLYQSKTKSRPLDDADDWLMQLQTGQAGMPATLAAVMLYIFDGAALHGDHAARAKPSPCHLISSCSLRCASCCCTDPAGAGTGW